MEQWLDFAKGPLFAFTFLFMILGLFRHVVLQIYYLGIRKGRRLRNAPWRKIILDTLTWAVPVKHFIPGTAFFSSASFLSHIGLILVPVFLVDHVVLWEGFLGLNLPSIGKGVADVLTLFTIACLIVLFCCRVFVGRQRAMSGPMDYLILIMVFLPFASGFLASHPKFNPFAWDTMMLTHFLSAEALFVLIPFTKLSHIVLFFFDRVSGLHWQLRPGAGDKVADALFGKEARV
ncbi:respiratory nitrate reductase subunit gamma [bacterium]|nr:respiratory nitrate reductase subunit gamma [bacterium]